MKKFKLNIQLFAEPGEPKTFTQEEVDKMIETRLKRENEKFEKVMGDFWPSFGGGIIGFLGIKPRKI